MRSAGEEKDDLKREQKGGRLDELRGFSSSFSRLAKFSTGALAPDALHHGKVRGQPVKTSCRAVGGPTWDAGATQSHQLLELRPILEVLRRGLKTNLSVLLCRRGNARFLSVTN